MNNLFKKISGLALGLALTLGAGISAFTVGNGAVKADAAEQTATLSFATADQRVSSSDTQQIWKQNGIVFTYNKGSYTNKLAEYHNPMRCYAGTKIAIGMENNYVITKVEFTANTSAYAKTLQGSISGSTISGSKVTWTGNTDELSFSPTAQVRLNSLTVTYDDSQSGDDIVKQKYTVTYDKNGAESGTVPAETTEYEEGTPVTVLGNTGNLVKEGYTFDGWNTAADGTGTGYKEKDAFNIYSNTTLYAVWTELGDIVEGGYQKITDLNALSEVVIATVWDGKAYALTTSTTSSAPVAKSVTLDGNNLTGVDNAYLFTVVKNSDGTLSFKNSKGSFLYVINDNNGVRVGTTQDSFTPDLGGNGYSLQAKNGRFLGIYNGTQWRSYTTSNAPNFKESATSINFYGQPQEVKPLKSLTVTGLETTTLTVGDRTVAGYSGLDTADNVWMGDVTFASSNTTVATVDNDGNIVALAAGTTQITVSSTAGEGGKTVTSQPVTLTVKPAPERVDLPAGEYEVVLSAKGLSSASANPLPTELEIIEKTSETWYKNISISANNVSVKFANEYTICKSTGVLTFTNNSNAVIETATVDWYRYDTNGTVKVGESVIDGTSSTSTSNSKSKVRIYSINSKEGFSIAALGTYDASFYTITLKLKVEESTPVVTPTDEVEAFIETYLDKGGVYNAETNKGTGACITEGWYTAAKEAFAALSDEAKALFCGENYEDECARLIAWATANGEVFNPTDYTFTRVSASGLIIKAMNENNSYVIIIIAGLVAASALVAYLVINNKRKNSK